MVNDRLIKVEKELEVLRKIFDRHEGRQNKRHLQRLTKGAAFFQNLCIFYSNELKNALNDEIAAVEA